MGRVIRAQGRGARVIPAEVASAKAEADALMRRARRRVRDLETQVKGEAREAARAELSAEYLQLARARAGHDAELERELGRLSLAACRELIGRELRLDPDAIRGVVAPLLLRLRRATRVTLTVHPDDHPALLRWLGPDHAAAGLALDTDPDMARGGCVLQSDIGDLDARVETRLDALAEAWQVRSNG